MFDKYSRTTTIGSDPFNDLHPPARSVHCLTVVGLLVTNAAIERSQPTTLDTRRGYVYVFNVELHWLIPIPKEAAFSLGTG
jgi:hypothetical protein